MKSEKGVQHLRCTECEDNITVAMRGGEVFAVCHCTHEDGEIDPVPVSELWLLHASRWEYVE